MPANYLLGFWSVGIDDRGLPGLRVFANSSVLNRSDTHNSLMDCSFDAVILFDVEFGKSIIFISRSVADISQSGSVDDVSVFPKKFISNLIICSVSQYDRQVSPDKKSFDCLVLRNRFCS